jgi:hypothetical protein
MKLTSTDAFELSRRFRDLSVSLGDYRFANWNDLTPIRRRFLEDSEWSLLNASSDMVSAAVGLVLDETEASFTDLVKASDKAAQAIKTLSAVRGIIKIAAAAIGLAGAIVAREPVAIAKRAKVLYDLAA